MKRNCSFIFIMLLLTILGLSACSSNSKVLSGKYHSAYNNEIYYEFFDENYSTNNIQEDIDIIDTGNGTYIIENNKIMIYINGNEKYQCEIGYIYNNYICSLWNGKIPDNNLKETEISLNLSDYLQLNCCFNSDETYKYTAISNNETVEIENGTYLINENEVVCTNKKGENTTFINIDENVYCIEYIKE